MVDDVGFGQSDGFGYAFFTNCFKLRDKGYACHTTVLAERITVTNLWASHLFTKWDINLINNQVDV